MKHRMKGSQLNRTSSHIKALKKNMAIALFREERIVTTKEKAREVKSFAEKLITLGKKKGLANYRRALSLLNDKTVVKKLFEEIAPKYENRSGGYTRIVKLPRTRIGDNASQVIFELVERHAKAAGKATKKGSSKKKGSAEVKDQKVIKESKKATPQDEQASTSEKEKEKEKGDEVNENPQPEKDRDKPEEQE